MPKIGLNVMTCARSGWRRLIGTGMAAEWLEVHPDTLRRYDRLGVVTPLRRHGRRYYTPSQLRALELVLREQRATGASLIAAARRVAQERGTPLGL